MTSWRCRIGRHDWVHLLRDRHECDRCGVTKWGRPTWGRVREYRPTVEDQLAGAYLNDKIGTLEFVDAMNRLKR